MSKKHVAYLRVSTQQQGRSGLGLESQQATVARYKPVETFVEVESGKRSDRPELAKALAYCRKTGATLVVAKLDRLARNVLFTATLMESGADFIACDLPNANRLTIHIMAAVAENEARLISERTKGALAAAKARGVKLGNPKNLTTVAARKGCRRNVAAAKEHRRDILPVAQKLRDAGRTLTEIAETLTGRGLLTRRGKAWSATAVMRLLAA